ncbi:MAG: radical SAM protein [Deltaproteobacteria bacterium]|nr:radical SAM protein [Deltaproteobacteria bacterium]
MLPGSPFLRLAPWAHPKQLETPCLYDARNDDLYEVNDEGFRFLRQCDGSRRTADLAPDPEFLGTCREEGLLEELGEPAPRALAPDAAAPTPSLRYLELQLTSRCNLACAHCCLGPSGTEDLPLPSALSALQQLEEMQGLRVFLTGGEPLLHPSFWELHERLDGFALRTVLLTNGHLVTPGVARRLRVHEVQVSLDGLEAGHDLLRGAGSYAKARSGLLALRDAGMPVSVATMVHRGNLGAFEAMAQDFEELGVREWGVDVPCRAGRWVSRDDLAVTPGEAAPCLGYAFGGSYHGQGSRDGCGLHLATVAPGGQVLRCGFFPEEPLGSLQEGLRAAWGRRKAWRLEGSRCAGCDVFGECGGGCRFRAGGEADPDPVLCAAYGVEP